MALITRFKNFADKLGQISQLIENAAGGEAPEFLNVNLKANIELPSGQYCLIISKDGSSFSEGFDKFTGLVIKTDENTWNEILDGNISLFRGYTSGRVEVPNFRPNRFNVFLLSGLISMLLSLKMKF
ncbi:MAG: hypothetical protein ACXQS8_04365 [Candidatus Helarchaeales archaeon]